MVTNNYSQIPLRLCEQIPSNKTTYIFFIILVMALADVPVNDWLPLIMGDGYDASPTTNPFVLDMRRTWDKIQAAFSYYI